jgi:hypothetical protein
MSTYSYNVNIAIKINIIKTCKTIDYIFGQLVIHLFVAPFVVPAVDQISGAFVPSEL